VLAFPEWKDKLNSRFKGYVNVKINRFKWKVSRTRGKYSKSDKCEIK
jgi:hypothetical protein